MLRATLPLALLAVLIAAEGEFAPDDDSAPYEDDEPAGEDGFLEANPQIQEVFNRLQRSIDADGLLRARRWGNIANGALLAATGPIALIVSVFGLKLSNVVLSLYVTAVSERGAPHSPPPIPRASRQTLDRASGRIWRAREPTRARPTPVIVVRPPCGCSLAACSPA